jgi:RNA polymerase sigma factor (sigma-70 family)
MAIGIDGDRSDVSFDVVFAAEYGRAVALAAYMVGSRAVGEEVAQEVFTRLLEVDLASIDNVGAWVRTAVVRRSLNEQRRQSREEAAHRRLEPPDGIGAGPVLTDPELAAALAVLSSRQRAAMLLTYGQDLSIEVVAETMGCSSATVRVHLHRARIRLRSLLASTTLVRSASDALMDRDPQERSDGHGH